MNELSNATAGLEVLRQAVSVIGDGQLGCPTPCRDFDVAALAGHLSDKVVRISAAAGVVVPASVDGAVMHRLVDTGRETLVGWRRRGLDGDVAFAGRTLPAKDLLGVIALEFVVHGWDFATAVGSVPVVPDDLAADLLRLAQRTVTSESRRIAGFHDPVAIGDDASALDRLLAFTGRRPVATELLR